MNTMRLIIPLMLALATVACGAERPVKLTEADNGRTNLVNAGRDIEIVLKGNPTTGYSWDVASFTTNKLRQIGTAEYLQSEQHGGKHRVGVGGCFYFRFKAVSPGQGNIKLIYRRPWETTASDQSYSVMIAIK